MLIHKKLILLTAIFFSLFSFLSLVPSSVHAVDLPTYNVTKVQGILTGTDGKPVVLAKITATCDGKTRNTITNAKGKYILFFFGKETCGQGSTVTITAEKDGKTTGGTGTVQLNRDGRVVDKNLTLVDMSFNVPEYNTLTLLLAFSFSAGAYILYTQRSRLQAVLAKR